MKFENSVCNGKECIVIDGRYGVYTDCGVVYDLKQAKDIPQDIFSMRDLIMHKTDHIEVEGHYGSWYIIDHEVRDGRLYLLCEHEEYGDETACIIVDHELKLVQDEIWNGFDDLDCV